MKKTLLTITLALLISGIYAVNAEAATINFTKPTLSVDTSQEESALSKKLKEIETQKAAKEAEAKKKQEERKKAIKDLQNSTKNSLNNLKKSFQ